MPNRYKLDAPVQTASSSLVVSFYGPNPTKTSCDFCRSRKRKCNGSVRECGKFKEGASVPASDPGSSKARRVASPSSSSSLPGKKRKRSLTATTVESDLIQISPSAYDDELSFPREQSYSLAEPSLDPLILFLDSIGVYDYVFDTKESYIGFRKPSREEDHVIERFCTSSHFYPFEVFKRFSLGHQMETMPHMLRYAFYAYCCRMSVPPAPTQISEKFYTLAKESMNWCMDNPSLTSLQALMLMNITAACFGDHPGRYKYRNMAFRMASYLRLDAPCLLYLPSGKELTEFEKDARDRCWRTCILTDNIHATISGHPRFFHYSFSQVASAGFFQYIPPNDLGKESLMYYLTTLSEVMFSIKECVSLPLSTAEEVESYRVRIRETEGRLTEWKFSLPPSFDVEASEAWSSVEMIGDVPVDVDRITIYLGYHACNCLIYRSRLLVVDSFADNQPRSAARSFDVAFRSAVLIAMTAKKTLSLKCFRSTLFPLSGYCVLISGLVLCNICSQFSDSVQEEEIRALVMVEMEFLKKMSEFWLMSKPWLDLLEAEFQHIL